MTTERQPFQFGQDPTTRSLKADEQMLEYLLTVLPENHETRGMVVQDLASLREQLQEAQKNEGNNQPGK